jgi:hypothetical protein
VELYIHSPYTSLWRGASLSTGAILPSLNSGSENESDITHFFCYTAVKKAAARADRSKQVEICTAFKVTTP